MRLKPIHDRLHGNMCVRYAYYKVLCIRSWALKRQTVEMQEQKPTR